MSIKPLGFVLLSGGIDSSTALAYAIRDCSEVLAISVDYGQRHRREILAAQDVARYYGIQHKTVDIIGIPKVMLTDKDAEVPNMSYSDIKGVSPTYVPFRNGQLISKIAGIAAHQCNITQSQGRIYIGTHAEDAAGDAYPDCRFDFVGAMAAAVYIGTYHAVQLIAPLIAMYKDDIVREGSRLGVPYELTWSCYKGEALHCGTCPTCRARHEGFVKAMVKDPTVYATREAFRGSIAG